MFKDDIQYSFWTFSTIKFKRRNINANWCIISNLNVKRYFCHFQIFIYFKYFFFFSLRAKDNSIRGQRWLLLIAQLLYPVIQLWLQVAIAIKMGKLETKLIKLHLIHYIWLQQPKSFLQILKWKHHLCR